MYTVSIYLLDQPTAKIVTAIAIDREQRRLFRTSSKRSPKSDDWRKSLALCLHCAAIENDESNDDLSGLLQDDLLHNSITAFRGFLKRERSKLLFQGRACAADAVL
jgi:hypothetical protein